MTSTSTSTLGNSAENAGATQIPYPSLYDLSSHKKRRMNSSSVMDTAMSGEGHIVKNKRTRYSAYQTETLKKIFESTQYPDFEQLAAIARELALDKEVVKIWFKNRRARQKTKNQEEAYRLSFLQRGSSSLPHFCCPEPVYCFPMYPVFPSPCQPMMNYHGNTAYGLYNKPTSIFEGRFDDNLYQNRPSVVVPSQERRPNESVACRRELNPYAHHTK